MSSTPLWSKEDCWELGPEGAMGTQGIQWEPADQQHRTIRQQDLGKTAAIAPHDKLPARRSCELSRP